MVSGKVAEVYLGVALRLAPKFAKWGIPAGLFGKDN
jgi:hypothetical protein